MQFPDVGTQYRSKYSMKMMSKKIWQLKLKINLIKFLIIKLRPIFPQLKTIAKQRNIIKNTLKKIEDEPFKNN